MKFELQAIKPPSFISKLHQSGPNQEYELGRVISEHKDRYKVVCNQGIIVAEILGNLRFTAATRKDLPAVGDWVSLQEYDEGKALINFLYPRSSIIERKATGKESGTQVVATNIDYAIIVTACGRDFNLNRVERYVTICNTSKVKPIIVLSKIDLIEINEAETLIEQLKNIDPKITVIAISNQTKKGLEELHKLLIQGKTYCLLGSSGVGKSTLINNLAGSRIMDTQGINEGIERGKHTTTHREMIILPGGSVIIDNPGMREVGITGSDEGLSKTFEVINDLAEDCKYADCSHIHEKGCAVLEGLEEGVITERMYQNYLKMYKEKVHYERSEIEQKQRDRKFGKLMKEVKKVRKKRKY